jgi:hypothetical protein
MATEAAMALPDLALQALDLVVSVNLGTLDTVFCVVSAFGSLAIMVMVTRDACLGCRLGRIKWAHRTVLMLVTIAFAVNAEQSFAGEAPPRAIDLIVKAALALALIFSAWRHSFAPPLPPRS